MELSYRIIILNIIRTYIATTGAKFVCAANFSDNVYIFFWEKTEALHFSKHFIGINER